MANLSYLFKNADNDWVCGTMSVSGTTVTITDEFLINPQDYRRRVTGDYVSLVSIETDKFVLPKRLISQIAKDVDGTPYASIEEFKNATVDFVISEDKSGIADGEYDATEFKSDTVDLPDYGWMEATTAGTVKYTTVKGQVHERTVEAGWVSLSRARKLWATGTSATIHIYY